MNRKAHLVLISVSIAFGLPHAASAIEMDKKIAICAAMEGDLERLSCFDQIASSEGLSKPQTQPVAVSDAGKWQISSTKNPIDDSPTVLIALEATSGASRWGEPVRFIARCKSNKTEAYINWNDFLGDDSSSVYQTWKRVTIRIGDQDPIVQKWGVSTDSKATFAPDWAGSLLKQMVTQNNFIAQVTPYGESPVTAIFDTTGMSNVLKPLADTCGWEF